MARLGRGRRWLAWLVGVSACVPPARQSPPLPVGEPDTRPFYVRVRAAGHALEGRWRASNADSVSVVVARLAVPPVRAARWQVGADIPGDSVVVSLSWSDVERWDVAAHVQERRAPRAVVVAAGFAGAVGGALLASGARGDAVSPMLSAALAGAMLGVSHPERRMQWRPMPMPVPVLRPLSGEAP